MYEIITVATWEMWHFYGY